jgi:beta-phosphoglucomutase
MATTGIAFDLEGTIVNVEPAHHGAWIRAAAEIDVHLSSPEDAMERIPNFSGGPEEIVIRQVYALRSDGRVPSEEEARCFHRRKWAHYEELLGQIDLAPRPGFLDVYERIHSRGLPMTIGTAVELERALPIFRRSGLDQLFRLSDIVFNADVKNPKPAPDCFIETARRMGVDPSKQIVFEDSPRGVRAGRAAGSRVIGMPVYRTKTTTDRLFEAGAHNVFFSWEDVPIELLIVQM